MRTRTQGFSTLEILLVIAVIGLIGAVGYLFVQSVQKQSSTDQSATTSTTTTTDTTPSTDESKTALESTQAFYKKFLAATDHVDGYPPSTWVSENYVTQAAADQYTNATAVDPVTCSQNPLPYDRYSFGAPSINGTTGTVHITGKYETGDSVMIMVSLVKDNSHWKISKFSCSM